MDDFNNDNEEIIFDDTDFMNQGGEPEDITEDITDDLGEHVPSNESWKDYVAEFGYGEEFLSDVTTEGELFKKIKYFEDERKLEDTFQDEEILEAIRLKKEGKISSIKDFAKHVYVEQEEVTEINNDDDAKVYLKLQLKASGMKEKHIETMINSMEVNDELISEANERLKIELEGKQTTAEKRKFEYLEKQDNEKKAFVQEFNSKILQMKETVVEQGWNKELKDYVNEELINTMLEMHTGKQTSKTLQRVAEALSDNKKAPKLIAALHLMIQDDDINLDFFTKQDKSKHIQEVQRNWKQSVSNKKISSGGSGFAKETEDINWDKY